MDFTFYSISKPGIFSRTYEIFNENHRVLTVKPVSFFSGSYNFYNEQEKEVLQLKRTFSFMKFQYEIIERDRSVAEISKGAFSKNYVLKTWQKEWITKGNFWGTEFTVNDRDVEIAKITREMFARRKAFKVGILEGYNDFHILALIVSIALIRQRRKNS